MQSIDKPDTPTRTPTSPASTGAEMSKEGRATSDDEDSESSPRQASQAAQTSQQYPEHRASIASAPPCTTTRKGSISTITGVCVTIERNRSPRAVILWKELTS